ncbi:MAG: AmmeMemoRadiSam system protein B [Candidatus Tectomicrobia bacterium]|uniref:AmmeMemoRadiSam system protein B n=1 Tax=Tectimicrobiota bacterium TaxID=2528274 RepID=A0A937VYQ5_UNCTE|nr:AmmeMemoRadiSam system protein B [Candidatus Tectomicrobia bacterium]
MALPALRLIDAFAVEQQGQRYICLRDPDGVVEHQVLLTPPAFFIACQLDGRRDVPDIQQVFARQYSGQRVAAEDIRRIVAHLDENGFLQTPRFVALQRRLVEEYTHAAVRPAYLAGRSYPAEAGALRVFLDDFFVRDGGPGAWQHTGRSQAAPPARCLIAPHIDFHRGGHSYAHGYWHLYQQGQPETVFIFGVAHASPPVPFLLTKKHFATPFGTLETDQDIVRRLEAVCTWDPYAHEMVHRTEHSIEFQAVMLAYLYGPHVRIVPILCAAFGPPMELSPSIPMPAVETFLETCRDVVDAAPGRVSVVAGADLAHVGRRFGDAFDIHEAIVHDVAGRDHEDLQHALRGDALGFYHSVLRDQNARRVCGLNCIYAALKTVDGAGGRGAMLHYDYAHDPAGGIVSFVNVLFP